MTDQIDNDLIDINSADEATLATLPGIGDNLAERIATYRQEQGPFTKAEELVAVPGISENMVAAIGDKIMVTTQEEPKKPLTEGEPPLVSEPESNNAASDSLIETDAAEVAENAAEGEPAADFTVSIDETDTPIPEEQLETADIPLTVPGEAVHTNPNGPMPTAVTIPRGCSRAAKRLFILGANRYRPFGAIFGAILTLSILWLINGTLMLNDTAQIEAAAEGLQLQVQQEAANFETGQNALTGDIERLDGAQAETASSLTAVKKNLDGLAETMILLEGDLADLEEAAVGLEVTTAELNEQISEISAAAEDFTTFLDGLRTLVLALEETDGVTTSPAAAATNTSPTSIPDVTRTPRPTATPLGLNPGGSATSQPE